MSEPMEARDRIVCPAQMKGERLHLRIASQAISIVTACALVAGLCPSLAFAEPQNAKPVTTDAQTPEPVKPDVSDAQTPEPVKPDASDSQTTEPVKPDVSDAQTPEPVKPDAAGPQAEEPVKSDTAADNTVDDTTESPSYIQEDDGDAVLSPTPVSTDGEVREPIEKTSLPDCTIKDVDGTTSALNKDYQGKLRIIVMGRSACENTTNAVKYLQKALSQQTYEDLQGFVLCLESADQDAFIEKYKDADQANVVYAADNDVYHTLLWETYQKAGFDSRSVSELPYMFFVDGEGLVRFVATGSLSEQDFLSALDDLMEQAATEAPNDNGAAVVVPDGEKDTSDKSDASEAAQAPEASEPESSDSRSSDKPNEADGEKAKNEDGANSDDAEAFGEAGTLGAWITVGNYEYELNSDNKTVTMRGYVNKPNGRLVIPSSVKIAGRSYPVTKLGAGSWYGIFQDCSGITSVVVPSSIKWIEQYAFLRCENLTSVSFPSSSFQLELGCFYGCTSLTAITIPKGLTTTSSANSPFEGSGLSRVTFANGVTKIEPGLFAFCKNLKSITIPKTITALGEGAFNASGLTSITIPSSIESIPDDAFKNCASLASVSISKSVTSIGASAFSNCDSLASIVIPTDVKTIGGYAFSSCDSLSRVTLGDHLTKISEGMFGGCKSLKSIQLPESIQSIGGSAFSGCPLGKLYIPPSVTSIDRGWYGQSIPVNTIIQGYDGTYAQTYAKDNNRFFESLGKILPNISGAAIGKIANQTYTGKAISPSVKVTYKGKTLKKGVDYSVSYANNTKKGTATVTVWGRNGYFRGSKRTTFSIVAPVSMKSVSVAKIADRGYTGKAISPSVKVTYKGKTLKKGVDYSVSYASNVRIGTATATVWARGGSAFTGSKKVSFSIVPAKKRLAGATALDTMTSITKQGFATKSCDTVVVATMGGYWDALTASSLAGLKGCPVLLTDKGKLSSQTASEIKRLGASRVYIAGGEAAVSKGVESSLRKVQGVASVKRLAGSTAVGTALKIYQERKDSWGNTAIVATSGSFQDALSISPYAYQNHAPIFLTNASTKKLDSSTLSAIKKGGFKWVIIVGGTAAVSGGVEKQLAGISTKRLAGDTAYETSTTIATWCIAHGMKADRMGIATGSSYYDALAGASLCGRYNSVLVLVDNGRNAAAKSFTSKRKKSITRLYVFGGPAAVSDATWREMSGALK